MSKSGHTLQDRGDVTVRLPDPYHCKPGDTYEIECKNAGQVTRMATFTLIAAEEGGEVKHRWAQCWD